MRTGRATMPPAWTEDRTLSEAKCLELLLNDLVGSGWTVIKREVAGQHLTGATLRVDAVVAPPEPRHWHTGSQAFALEAKKPLPGDSTDHAALVVQALDYRHTNWQGFGPLPVMVWPEPFGDFGGDQAALASRAILSRLRVLPLRWVKWHGWWLGLNATRIWSAEKGATAHAANWDLQPRWGNQG